MFLLLRHPLLKTLIVLFLLLSALFVYIIVAEWYPKNSIFNQLNEEIKLSKQKLANNIQIIKFVEQYNKTLNELTILEEKLNVNVTQSYLKSTMNEAAIKSNIKIISESYEEGRMTNDFIPLFQELTLKGDYPSLKKFLVAITNFNTWTEVIEAQITRDRKQNQQLEILLKLVTYRKKPELS
jgi:hypothetical protein